MLSDLKPLDTLERADAIEVCPIPDPSEEDVCPIPNLDEEEEDKEKLSFIEKRKKLEGVLKFK